MLQGQPAGDHEPLCDDPLEAGGVNKIVDALLVREQGEGGFLRVVHDLEGLAERQVRLHQHALGEVHEEPEPPHSFFLIRQEFPCHGGI